MKLKKLAPPLELCKLIPEGGFEDSALVYLVNIRYGEEKAVVCQRDHIYLNLEGSIMEIYPAPTFEEITEELGQFTASCYDRGHTIEIATGWDCASADSAVDGAMKLWLKTKGIKYGKANIR